MCRFASRAIAISQAVAAPIPCTAKTSVVPNGLDLNAFERADGLRFRAESGVNPQQPLVGIVGRLVRWKGQRDFLDAAARVLRQRPEARFAVVGDALFSADHDEMADLRQYAQHLGIAHQVTFTGHREDVGEVMAGLDLLVHCSEAEPFGRVLIEGMAAGCPVVAYADGGVPEIVVDGVTGVLVPPKDIDGLARAISTLLDDPTRRAALGQAGQRRASEHYTAEASARQVEQIYEEILRGNPASLC
jgi:glycosyltransferase involved in cell wall biosynthesis